MNNFYNVHTWNGENYILNNELLKNAKTLFIKNGFKSTGIRDITNVSKVSIGTFYNYFDSKEDIFLDIFLEENERLNRKISHDFRQKHSLGILRKAILAHISEIEQNPILKVMFDANIRNKILKKLTPEKYRQYELSAKETFMPYLKELQNLNIISDIDPEFIFVILSTVYQINLDKKRIGEQYFPQLTEFIIEAVVNNLKQ